MNYDDAPPPCDDDYIPGEPDANTVANGIVINRLVGALDRLTAAIEKGFSPQISPGGAPPIPGPAPGPPSAPPGGTDADQIYRGKKIYAICMNQNPKRDVKATGEAVVSHTLHWNSQKWTEADQLAVLSAMGSWGWNSK